MVALPRIEWPSRPLGALALLLGTIAVGVVGPTPAAAAESAPSQLAADPGVRPSGSATETTLPSALVSWLGSTTDIDGDGGDDGPALRVGGYCIDLFSTPWAPPILGSLPGGVARNVRSADYPPTKQLSSRAPPTVC